MNTHENVSFILYILISKLLRHFHLNSRSTHEIWNSYLLWMVIESLFFVVSKEDINGQYKLKRIFIPRESLLTMLTIRRKLKFLAFWEIHSLVFNYNSLYYFPSSLLG